MTNNNEKKEQLAEHIKQKNEEIKLKSMIEFMRLSHLIDKYLDSTLGVFGLNRTQRRLINFILSKNESMTPTELSKLSLLTIDAVNKSIDNLDKKGLTRSYRSKKDRRLRKVALTDKGLEIIEKTLPVRNETFEQAMTCFNEKEIKTFLNYMQRLEDQISRLMVRVNDNSSVSDTIETLKSK